MKYLIPLAIIAILIPSCYPSYGLTTSDYRTVVTLYDTAADFSQLRSYYIIDSVFHIKDDNDKDTITREYDEELISKIASNFNSYGWSRVTDTTGPTPATVVKVSVTSSTTFGAYWNYWYPWYPGWGGGWWGYPGWGWGGYYPPYWGGGGVYSYSTGSLIVELSEIVEPDDPADSLDIRPVWIGSGNGLLSSSTSSNLEQISFEIRQMFDQSPYLNLPVQP